MSKKAKKKKEEEIIEEKESSSEVLQQAQEAQAEAVEQESKDETESKEVQDETVTQDSQEDVESSEETEEAAADDAPESESSVAPESESSVTPEPESSAVPEPVEGVEGGKGAKKSKTKKSFSPKKVRFSFAQGFDHLQSNLPALIIACLSAFLIMIIAGCAVFFTNVKGAEKVLVPNVVGKKWDEAFIEMQIKELYPKINLRYSNVPGDEGLVLEQSPQPGAIVKGYSRINLVISRGVVIDAVGSYVGKNLSEVQMSLQTLFAGQTKPLITLATPSYIPDASEAGTILEQDPPEGSKISEPVVVNLVVSRGPNYENTRRPYVIGQSINDLLQTIARTKIVFDITSHQAGESEKPGTVVSQQTIEDEYVPNYTRVTVEMAMPEASNDDNAYGIFQEKLPDYPYPVPMKLEAYPAEGTAYTIVNFNHPGGNLTIPYEVPRGTTLVLSVADKVEARKLVE